MWYDGCFTFLLVISHCTGLLVLFLLLLHRVVPVFCVALWFYVCLCVYIDSSDLLLILSSQL
jgi:cbb3-type cytochrome oxidase subunit 1